MKRTKRKQKPKAEPKKIVGKAINGEELVELMKQKGLTSIVVLP